MELYKICYMYEHKLIPQWFFKEKERFVGLILQNKEILYRIMDDIFQKENVENPYSPEQFDITTGRIADKVMMMKLIFPEPFQEPLCHCIYLFFDEEFDKLGLFCIEKGNDNALPFICAWTQDGSHVNYGNCTLENQNDFQRCADIFMEREYGLKRVDEP